MESMYEMQDDLRTLLRFAKECEGDSKIGEVRMYCKGKIEAYEEALKIVDEFIAGEEKKL